VAAARKLTVILYHMLTRGEAYYAAPERSTDGKLQRFRYHATGKRQESDPRKGSAPSLFHGIGTKGRTAKARLDRERLIKLQREYESPVSERLQEASRTGDLPENR